MIRGMVVKIYFLLLLLTVLPGNSIYAYPVKDYVCYILIALLISTVGCKLKLNKYIIMSGVILFGAFIWTYIGVLNEYEQSLQHFKNFLSLFSVVLITYFIIINRMTEVNNIIKVLYITMFLKIVSKLIIVSLLYFNILNYNDYLYIYNVIFGTRPVSMLIDVLNVVRIQTPSDAIPITILGFFLCDKKISLPVKIGISFLSLLYVVVVYSRLIMVQYLAVLIVAFIFAMVDTPTIKKAFIICISLFITLFLSYLTVQNFYTATTSAKAIIFDRMVGQSAASSDYMRDYQKEYLLKAFNDHVVIGSGLGAYTNEVIRSTTNTYSYEVEYYAFLMQLGIVGFVFIIIGSIVLFWKMINYSNVTDKIIKVLIIMNFTMWVIRPFYNPFFVSSNSGMTIAILIIESQHRS